MLIGGCVKTKDKEGNVIWKVYLTPRAKVEYSYLFD